MTPGVPACDAPRGAPARELRNCAPIPVELRKLRAKGRTYFGLCSSRSTTMPAHVPQSATCVTRSYGRLHEERQ